MVDSMPDWVPENVDLSVPSAARMYDYFLGGAHNFGIDRELAGKILQVIPDTQRHVRANRAFLHRAAKYLVGEGVRQFIDIGSGIPTVGNVHETVLKEAPDSRVLYVDHDAVAVAHSDLILNGQPQARMLQADLRQPNEILDSALLADLIDLSQPVGVLMVAVLHFISEAEHPEAAIRQFRDRLAPGSYLVISHGTGDGRPASAESVADLYKSAADGLTIRTHQQVTALFEGWNLVDPGVVWVPQWRPNWPDEVGPDPASSYVYAGVGQKPA